MGALARALKAKFPGGPRQALKVLGLSEDLLNPEHLASDAKQRARREAARRGMAIDSIGTPEELRAARDLHGEAFEKEQRRLDREMEDGMIDDEEDTEEDPRRMWMHEHEDEAPPDEELQARRRWWMKKVGDFMLAHGKDGAAVRAALNDMPRTGLEHLGGALDADVDTVMSRLIGMGSGSTTGPGYEDSPKAGDKRRAHDRKLALDAKRERNFLRRFPEAERLTPRGNDFCNYGDQPTLAYDESADDGDSSEFYEMFPMARRLGIPG